MTHIEATRLPIGTVVFDVHGRRWTRVREQWPNGDGALHEVWLWKRACPNGGSEGHGGLPAGTYALIAPPRLTPFQRIHADLDGMLDMVSHEIAAIADSLATESLTPTERKRTQAALSHVRDAHARLRAAVDTVEAPEAPETA